MEEKDDKNFEQLDNDKINQLEKDIKKIYRLINQLLVKDLLDTNNQGIEEILSGNTSNETEEQKSLNKEIKKESKMIKGTESNFLKEVLEENGIVLVVFMSKMGFSNFVLKPICEEIVTEGYYKKIVAIDIDKQSKLIKRYGINTDPTLIFFKNGEIIDKTIGIKSKLIKRYGINTNPTLIFFKNEEIIDKVTSVKSKDEIKGLFVKARFI